MDWGFSGNSGVGGDTADWQSECSAEDDYEALEVSKITSLLRGIDDELYRYADEHFAKSSYDDDDDGYAIGASLLDNQESTSSNPNRGLTTSTPAEDDDDPAAAAKMWYMNRAMEDAVPYKDWVSKFPFMRVKGTRIDTTIDPTINTTIDRQKGTEAGADADVAMEEETVLAEDDTRGEVKRLLVNELLRALAKELGQAGKDSEKRKATVTKYVAGARS